MSSRKRVRKAHQRATPDGNFRRVALSWIPTECACGYGALLPREEPSCGCERVLRRERRDEVIEVLVTGLSAEQLADQFLMNSLALTQLRARRRERRPAVAKKTRPAKPEKTRPEPSEPSTRRKPKRTSGEHRRDYKAEYVAYIASAVWKRKRREYIAAVQPTECPMCLGPWDVGGHIHHKSYKHIGDEPLADLVHLCEECHDKVHQLYQRPVWRRKGLRATTDHLLESARAAYGRVGYPSRVSVTLGDHSGL